MGNTGLFLSEISLGTMYYGSYISPAQGIDCLNRAVELGINFIDSADRYGIKDNELDPSAVIPAEVVVGKFLKDHQRTDLVLSTKVHHQLRESPNSGGLGRKHIREQLEISLQNLGTEYVDIYYCHRPDPGTSLEETVRTMTNLIEEGKINYWGTSWWPPYLIERAIGIAKLIGAVAPVVEQPPYHLRARFIEPDLFKVVNHHHLGLTPFEGLSSGLFTGKYNDAIPEDARLKKLQMVDEGFFAQIQPKLQQMEELAATTERTMYQLALAWVLSHEEITSTITGARLPEQVEMNTSASGMQLESETIRQLEEIFVERQPIYHYR